MVSPRAYVGDVTGSILPILGPLSGGSWMTISPIAVGKAILGIGAQPERQNSKYTSKYDQDNVDVVESIRIPLDGQMELVVKTYSKSDYLRQWNIAELHEHILSSLRAELNDPDVDEFLPLKEIYEVFVDGDRVFEEGES